MSVDAIYGLLAQGVIVATIIRFVRELLGHATVNRYGTELLIPIAVVLAGSIGGVSLAGHLRGLWGDPSIVTFLLLVLYTVHPSWLPSRPRTGTCMLLTICVLLPLYLPLVLSIPMIQTDLYSLGWEPQWILVGSVGVIGLYFFARRLDHRWVNMIALALLAYASGLMESDNLLDYLVDPGLLFTIAFLALAGTVVALRGRMIPRVSAHETNQGANT